MHTNRCANTLPQLKHSVEIERRAHQVDRMSGGCGNSELAGMMTHGTSDMTVMEDPGKCFGESVCDVNDARNGKKEEETTRFPVLDSKVLYVDMASARCWLGGVDDEYRGSIVFVDWGR